MLKLILLWGNILHFCFALTGTETALSYCNTANCKKGESIACKYTTDSSIKCKSGSLLKLNTTYILNLHNSKRNTIALGDKIEFSEAVSMSTVKWSTELEQMAKYNVMTCVFGHDTCRNTNTFSQSGQNLYTKSGTGVATIVVDTFVKDAVNAWFNEYKLANKDLMQSYADWGKPAGHFTSMMRDTNHYVGCALNKYTVGTTPNVYFACNYETTNIIGKPIYIAGPTGTKCPNGKKNTIYTGLCA